MSGIGFSGVSNFAYTAVATAVGVVATGGVSGAGVILSSGLVATLDLNFAGTAALPATVTFSRGTNATFTNSAGKVQLTSGVNDPRFDYDPITLVCKGLLIEEARTNSIRNNTMQGAVVGTPGTPPTNTSITAGGGVSSQIVSIGVESGVNYYDVRFFGTASSVVAQRAYLEIPAVVAALTGQSWTFSAYLKLISGTTPVNLFIGIDETGPGATYIRTDQANLSVTNTLTRYTYSTALSGGASVAFILPQIGFNPTISNTYDFTLRIGLPQLELGAFATSVIPTTAAAATRNADVAVMTGANFSSWYNQTQGTFVSVFDIETAPLGSVTNKGVWSAFLDSSNCLISYATQSGGVLVDQVVVSGASQASLVSVQVLSANTQYKDAFGYTENDFARSFMGNTVQTDTSGTVPSGLTSFRLGYDDGSSPTLNGHIARITYYPTRLPNATLQALTAPPPTTGFAVKSAAGTSYSTTRNVLSAAGTSYAVSATVLSANGTSYTPI